MPDQPAPDFEEARRIAENHHHNDWALGEVSRAYLALLSEREAREELHRKLRERERVLREAAWNAVKVDAITHPKLAQERLNQLDTVLTFGSLPATESAQAEEEG